MDRSYVQLNRAATERLRRLVNRLTDEQFHVRVGEHWTVIVCLVHLAFWERRAMHVIEMTRKTGAAFTPNLDIVLNDLSLPIWAAVPPREAARLALEACDACDKQLEALPDDLLEIIYANRQRDVVRALHRNSHLDEVDAALAA